MELAELAAEFVRESIRGSRDQATRMLAEHPELATYSLATEIILGEADLVRQALTADPSLVTRQDPRTGWYALHAACASRWHQLDPARADGLLAIATMLLDAGADPQGPPVGQWTPLRCAVAARVQPGDRRAAARTRRGPGRPRPVPRGVRR